MMLLLSFCLLFGHIGHLHGADPTVEISEGNAIRGTTMTSTDGREFFAFLGIPYAEPPVGDLRFKAPVPKCPWEGVYNATKVTQLCSQYTYWGELIANEDCLYLNVFTPHLKSKKLPVFVFIHEGGFNQGGINFTSDKAPQRLMNKDIVVVLMSYRLGTFGFLSTSDDNFPGNYGLLDQNLALKWVQENIAAFGGIQTQ